MQGQGSAPSAVQSSQVSATGPPQPSLPSATTAGDGERIKVDINTMIDVDISPRKAAKAAAAQDAPALGVSIAPRTSQHDQAVSVGLSVEQVRVLSWSGCVFENRCWS